MEGNAREWQCAYLAAAGVSCGALNAALGRGLCGGGCDFVSGGFGGCAGRAVVYRGFSVMNGLWTTGGDARGDSCRLLASKARGLPLGVQVVGRFGGDAGVVAGSALALCGVWRDHCVGVYDARTASVTCRILGARGQFLLVSARGEPVRAVSGDVAEWSKALPC